MLARSTQWFAHKGVRYRVLRWHVGGAGSAAASSLQAPLVFLHGFAQSADSWNDVVECLGRTDAFFGNAYAVDFAGHGESDKPACVLPYSMDAACDMLLAFLCEVRGVNGGRVPAVVGYSMGGRIALAAASRALRNAESADQVSLANSCAVFGAQQGNGLGSGVGEHGAKRGALSLPLSALALESAGLGPASSGERISVARANAERARFLRECGVERFMDDWERLPLFASQCELPDSARARLRASRLANDAEALARTLEGTGAQHMPAQEETLASTSTSNAPNISHAVLPKICSGTLHAQDRSASFSWGILRCARRDVKNHPPCEGDAYFPRSLLCIYEHELSSGSLNGIKHLFGAIAMLSE